MPQLKTHFQLHSWSRLLTQFHGPLCGGQICVFDVQRRLGDTAGDRSNAFRCNSAFLEKPWLWGDKKCFNYGDDRKKEKRSRVLLASSLLLFHHGVCDGKRRSRKAASRCFSRESCVPSSACARRVSCGQHLAFTMLRTILLPAMGKAWVKKWVTTRRCDNHAGKHACFDQPSHSSRAARLFLWINNLSPLGCCGDGSL